MSYVFVSAGLLLLILGGELLVRGSVSLAHRLGISPLVVGLTVVGFGTSAPELGVSIQAAMSNAPGIVIGNIIGSGIANILLVLAVAILIVPIKSWQKTATYDALVMLMAALILFGIVHLGTVTFVSGLALVVAIIIYLLVTYWYERESTKHRKLTPHEQEARQFEDIPLSVPFAGLAAVGGIGLLIGGSYLLIEGSVAIARSYGISESIIGLTLVSIGTSLPELATAIVAAIRRRPDVILGNIIGSNIFNIFCVLGVTASITDIVVEDRFRTMDAPILVGASLIVFVILARFRSIHRSVGFAVLLLYGAYIHYLYLS